MDTESLVQPCRQFTSLETSEELAGHLEVRDGPEITTGYADIYHGVWTSPQGERSEVAIKEFKTLTPRSRQSDLEALRRRTDTVRSFERVSPSPWCRHGNLTDYLQASPELSRIDRLRLVCSRPQYCPSQQQCSLYLPRSTKQLADLTTFILKHLQFAMRTSSRRTYSLMTGATPRFLISG